MSAPEPCVFCREPVAAGESCSKYSTLCDDCAEDEDRARRKCPTAHLEGPQ